MGRAGTEPRITAAADRAAALVFAWTLTSGHTLSAVTSAQPIAGLTLAVVDIGTGLLVLSRWPVHSDRPSRATRRAVRRAKIHVGGRPGTRASVWRSLHFLLLPSATASLPRPLRGLLAAALWISVLAGTSQIGTLGGSVRGQQFVASIWMMHLIVWCSFACKSSPRSRYANG